MHKKSKNATANRYSLTFFPKPRESYLIVKEKHLQKAWKIFRATEKKRSKNKKQNKKEAHVNYCRVRKTVHICSFHQMI